MDVARARAAPSLPPRRTEAFARGQAGGDWTLLRADGVLELDLRLTLETDDGALIHMASFGLRHGPPEMIAALGRGESVDPSTYYPGPTSPGAVLGAVSSG